MTADDRTAILSQRRVAHVVQAVLDRPPMPPADRQQLRGISLISAQRRDVVRRFSLPTTADDALSDDPADLADVWPVEVRVQPRGAGQRASFQASMAFVEFGVFPTLRRSLLLGIGGKKLPAEQRIRVRFLDATEVDCL